MEDFYFPLELESRLINSVKSGNYDNLSNLLETLSYENMESRFLDSNKMKVFLSSLYSTCFRILNQLPDRIRDELAFSPDRYSSEPEFETIRNLLMEICQIQNKSKKSHNNTLIEKLRDYLEKNYSNRNLSLLMVADHFSISESYLSYFFKEQTGINFSTFLENIRMTNGKDLLMNSDEPIHIIAGKVGYNSDKSFRRVFQKSFHISPGKFRENL
jgi:YesN/AraC family two-component response regulator